jgi:flagellar L-ring protein precursor FlgH
MTARINFITRVSALGLLALGLGGCATAPEPLAHSPQFAPVIPVAIDKPRMATGAIYNGRHSDNFFGRSRNYRVGDLITVMLDESTRAIRKQTGTVKREASNDVIPSGLVNKALRIPSKIFGSKKNR